MLLLLACTNAPLDSTVDSEPKTTWVRLETADQVIEFTDTDGAAGPAQIGSDGRIETAILDIRASQFGDYLGLKLEGPDTGAACGVTGACSFALATTQITGSAGVLVDTDSPLVGGTVDVHGVDLDANTLSASFTIQVDVGVLTGELHDARLTR